VRAEKVLLKWGGLKTLTSTLLNFFLITGVSASYCESSAKVFLVIYAGVYFLGVVIDGAQYGQNIASPKKVWVYWYGDHRFTEVSALQILKVEFYTSFIPPSIFFNEIDKITNID